MGGSAGIPFSIASLRHLTFDGGEVDDQKEGTG